MTNTIERLTAGEVLSRAEAKEIMTSITEGQWSDVQIAALLTTLNMRGVTVDELLGLRDGLLSTGRKADLGTDDLIDIVGTGGDGKNTFNISTCAAMVVAGAGFRVAKHGNSAATSRSGASDVLAGHGVKFTFDTDKLRRNIAECSFTYLHAPLFALGMKSVAPVRRALGVPTAFNLLGPLVNPARPRCQLLGVARLQQMRLYSSVYERLGTSYGIVNSVDGYDEISLTGDFKVKSPTTEKVFRPADLGLAPASAAELSGGETADDARRIFDSVLEGTSTRGQRDAVLANAAFAIKTRQTATPIDECLAIARESLDSGRALSVLKRYVELNS